MKRILLSFLILTMVLTGCTSKSENNNSFDNFESETADLVSSTSTINTTKSVAETTELISATHQENTTISTHSAYPTYQIETSSETVPEDGQLVRILDFIPDAEIDLRYATTNHNKS